MMAYHLLGIPVKVILPPVRRMAHGRHFVSVEKNNQQLTIEQFWHFDATADFAEFSRSSIVKRTCVITRLAKTVPALCGVHVLIVDDNPEVLQAVARMVNQLGCQTTTAEDALMALYYLRKSCFDVVISDYDMPFMDGYELADQIKESYFGTGFIMMTGHCEADVLEMMRASSIVDGLLFKPFNMQSIKAAIENAL